jgi:hypothetical protein
LCRKKVSQAIDPERFCDLSELTSPKSVKKVQSILGILNYVRNFVPHFSDKARFLTDKLVSVSKVVPLKRPQADVSAPKRAVSDVAAMDASVSTTLRSVKTKTVSTFSWSSDDERQFQELKAAVLAAPMLSILDYSKPIFIRCDASRFGAGAVLFQYDSRGFEHPVCYASRKCLPAERGWSTFAQCKLQPLCGLSNVSLSSLRVIML